MRKNLPLGLCFVAHYFFRLIVPLPSKLWSASQEVCDPWDEIIRTHTCISSSFLPCCGDWIVLKALQKLKKHKHHSIASSIQVILIPLQDVNNYSAIVGAYMEAERGPLIHKQWDWGGPRLNSSLEFIRVLWYEMSVLLVYNHLGALIDSS